MITIAKAAATVFNQACNAKAKAEDDENATVLAAVFPVLADVLEGLVTAAVNSKQFKAEHDDVVDVAYKMAAYIREGDLEKAEIYLGHLLPTIPDQG